MSTSREKTNEANKPSSNRGWRIKLEKRLTSNRLVDIVSGILSILAAFIVSGVMLKIAGYEVLEAYYWLFVGAFGDMESIIGTLVKSIPFVFTGLATVIAFRAQIWNIGQEGQVFAGAMMAYWISTMVDLPPLIFIPVVMIAGFIGGAMLSGLAGVLKAHLNVDEIVSTVMMNYLILLGLSYLFTSRAWMPPEEFISQTPPVAEAARLPIIIPDSNLHLGFILAILAIVAIQILITKTTMGYEIRAFGSNPIASQFRGINSKRLTIIVLLISGGLCGLAGSIQTFGLDYRLSQNYLVWLGSGGIIVAVIAGLKPYGVALAAFLFGALAQGSLFMQVMVNVSSPIVQALQAIILMFFLFSSVISKYRIVRV